MIKKLPKDTLVIFFVIFLITNLFIALILIRPAFFTDALTRTGLLETEKHLAEVVTPPSKEITEADLSEENGKIYPPTEGIVLVKFEKADNGKLYLIKDNEKVYINVAKENFSLGCYSTEISDNSKFSFENLDDLSFIESEKLNELLKEGSNVFILMSKDRNSANVVFSDKCI